MQDRFNFRIPQFNENGRFRKFFYMSLGGYIPAVLGGGYSGEPQQCTGLKDKNGKLIYEGDIVRTKFFGKCNKEYHSNFNDFDNFVIIWRKCMFLFSNEHSPNQAVCYVEEFPQHFEIIGNIYENPKLLEV